MFMGIQTGRPFRFAFVIRQLHRPTPQDSRSATLAATNSPLQPLAGIPISMTQTAPTCDEREQECRSIPFVARNRAMEGNRAQKGKERRLNPFVTNLVKPKCARELEGVHPSMRRGRCPQTKMQVVKPAFLSGDWT